MFFFVHNVFYILVCVQIFKNCKILVYKCVFNFKFDSEKKRL